MEKNEVLDVRQSHSTTLAEGSYLVEFNGGRYWWLKNADGTGPLALLEHCDEHGQLVAEIAFSSPSFAYVYEDGKIRRFGKTIGRIDELKFV